MRESSHSDRLSRRRFLAASAAANLAGGWASRGVSIEAAEPSTADDSGLSLKLGIVSASAGRQLAGQGGGRGFTLLELPKILRDELGMSLLDLNTSSIPKFTEVSNAYLDRLRSTAAKAGCTITNLKMNQRGIDMNSPDKGTRARAIAEYKRSIDIAARLGCRWARPLPQAKRPNMSIHVSSYQVLCDYAASRNVVLLVENFGWMQGDPESVVKLVKSIGRNVVAGPDTGNWDSNAIRYEGLKQTFPLAVTCDFKARKLGPQGEHSPYDLKRCFEIGWQSGYRGPWCFEHANSSTADLMRELVMLREMLVGWMKQPR